MKRNQAGQALPLGLALLLAGTLTGVMLFNTGQVINEKTRLANAADASVYSGLQWQARALNFNAYTNRAMVANQVAMAQAVSLQSWAQYARVSSANVGVVLAPVPILGQIASATQRVMQAFEPIIEGFGNGILAVVDPVNSALSLAQEAMYLSAYVATPELVNSVAKAHDDRLVWKSAFSTKELGKSLNHWQSFTEQHTTHHSLAMDERVAMINASTDAFTKKRSWEFFKKYLPVTPFHWLRIDRSGETRLLRDSTTGETEWKALDTVSLNSKFYYWFKKHKRVEVPIGYSHKFANTRENSIEDCEGVAELDCRDWFGRNRTAQRLARHVSKDLAGGSNTAKSDLSYSGVRAFRSLSAAMRKQQAPTLSLSAELRLPTSQINDSSKLGISSEMNSGLAAEAMPDLSSLSTAEVYFNRPGDDNYEEYASGYNPFWTVRLAASSEQQYASASALRPTGQSSTFVLAHYAGDAQTVVTSDSTSATALPIWKGSVVGPSAQQVDATFQSADNALRTVFTDLANRLFSAALPGVTRDTVDDFSDELMSGVDTDDIEATVASVNQDIDTLRQEYRAAREQIQAEFLQAANELTASVESRRQAINEEIDALREGMNSVDQRGREELEAQVRTLVEERDGIAGEGGLRAWHRDQLAATLVGIVKKALPQWPISLKQAYEAVDNFTTYNGDVADQFHIIQLPDSEDDLNE